MYHYLYHQDLQTPKYAKHALSIESYLHKLGLEGKSIKLGRYTNLVERLKELNFGDRDTLVVIGNEALLFETITELGLRETKPVFAFIPIDKETNITKNLGLPLREEAVLTLGNRRIESFDLGKINKSFFIESISIPSKDLEISIDHTYKIIPPKNVSEVYIQNFTNSFEQIFNPYQILPNDELLNVLFIEKESSRFRSKNSINVQSIFGAKEIFISSTNPKIATIDHYIEIKTPLEIGVKGRDIQIIVGKKRLI